MAGLNTGGFYDKYQQQRSISNSLLSQMGASTGGYSQTSEDDRDDKEKKTLGGALMATGGGVAAGAMTGSPGGPWTAGTGAMVGGAIGFAGYMFS